MKPSEKINKKYPNKLGRIAPVILWFADRFEKELIFKTAYVLSLLQKDWVKENLRIGLKLNIFPIFA